MRIVGGRARWWAYPRSAEASQRGLVRPEKRRKYDPEFGEGAVRIVRENGKPIAVVASDLGSTRASGVERARIERGEKEDLTVD